MPVESSGDTLGQGVSDDRGVYPLARHEPHSTGADQRRTSRHRTIRAPITLGHAAVVLGLEVRERARTCDPVLGRVREYVRVEVIVWCRGRRRGSD